LSVGLWWIYDSSEAREMFEIERSDSEWRRLLTKAQYDVLRLHRTEIPGSSPLNREKRAGIFA
jgi:peptide-methionine (R)-S-oxide reductase